jgi:hypothetical protein
VLDRYTNDDGDMWEQNDPNGRPLVIDGLILNNPGHATEFAGLSLKFLRLVGEPRNVRCRPRLSHRPVPDRLPRLSSVTESHRVRMPRENRPYRTRRRVAGIGVSSVDEPMFSFAANLYPGSSLRISFCSLLLLGLSSLAVAAEPATRPSDNWMPYNYATKFGYLTRDAKTGQFALPPEHQLAHPFKDGLAAVLKDGLWGFIDEKGAVVIPHQFEEVQGNAFQGGIAIVKKKQFWGVIDRDGKELLPFKHRQIMIDPKAARFAAGLPNTTSQYGGMLWGLYNLTGEQLHPHDIEDMRLPFVGGVTSVSKGYGKHALMNVDGKLLSDAKYDKIIQYDYTTWWIGWDSAANATAAFNERGELKFTAPYERVGGMFQGRATFQDPKTKTYGFLDENGKIVIPAQFSLAMGFREGLALVSRKLGAPIEAIDLTGKSVAGPAPNTYIRSSGFENGLVWLGDETTKDVHCYDRNLKKVFPQSFRYAREFDDNGLAQADLDTHKSGLINRKGEWVLQPEWSTINRSSIPGQYIVTKRDAAAIADKGGKMLTEPQACSIAPYDELFVKISPPGWGRPGIYYCFWRADGVFFYHAGEERK